MKVGLFFGSFNPIHVGHQIIAQSVLNETDLKEVWLMVSPQNPFKKKKNLLGEYDRLRMVELALDNNDHIRASNFEFFLPKPSYTIDTLMALKERYPKHEFCLIMGEDNLQYLHKWKNAEALIKYYTIYAYPRLGSDGSNFEKYPQIKKFDLPLLDISATRIREMIKEGKSIRYLVDERVFEYIETNHLYAN